MEDSNILIAEFMGYVFVNGVYESPKDEFHIDEMLYHTSWDWLMPVVEKIENIAIDEDVFYDVLMHGLECSIGHVCNVGQTKMEAVYKSVLEFIKQHNKNKKA